MSSLNNFQEALNQIIEADERITKMRRERDHYKKLWQEASNLAVAEETTFIAENTRLREALEHIANHNDNQRLTREADDMADIAGKALQDKADE